MREAENRGRVGIAVVALVVLAAIAYHLGTAEPEDSPDAADGSSAEASVRSRAHATDAPLSAHTTTSVHADDAGITALGGTDAATSWPTASAPGATTVFDEASARDAIAAIATLQDRLAAYRATLIASGASEASADSLTASMRAQDSALRFTQLGAGDPGWPARIDEYAAQREALARDGHDTPAALDRLREHWFPPAERERAHAWEALDAMLRDAR